MQKHEVSIIIPAYNEEQLLEKAIDRVVMWARQNTKRAEIIVAENGSTDKTPKIADILETKYAEVRVLHLKEANFGLAFRAAMQKARFGRAILLNADWIDTDFISRSLPLLDVSDLVVGSKVLDPSSDHRPFLRKLLSKLLNIVIRVIFKFKGSDSHGLKAFNVRSVLPLVNSCMSLEIIETELLLRAQWGGLKIVEVPVGIEELRPPRLGILKRCVIVARELWLLNKSLRDIRQTSGAKRASRG